MNGRMCETFYFCFYFFVLSFFILLLSLFVFGWRGGLFCPVLVFCFSLFPSFVYPLSLFISLSFCLFFLLVLLPLEIVYNSTLTIEHHVLWIHVVREIVFHYYYFRSNYFLLHFVLPKFFYVFPSQYILRSLFCISYTWTEVALAMAWKTRPKSKLRGLPAKMFFCKTTLSG